MKAYYQQTGELPEVAGLAKIKYKDIANPHRNGDVITLPKSGWGIYQLSCDFSLFIAIKDKSENHDSRYTPPHKAWFGGTDELPFLVELDTIANPGGAIGNGDDFTKNWLNIWQKGLALEVLKPQLIREFEKAYGHEKTKRQGDMFCYPMPIQDWDKLLCVLNSAGQGDWSWGPQDQFTSGRSQLYNTRHTFKGELAAYATRGCVVCKGTIKAPDHKDLILDDIHVVVQTANLMHPEKAD